MKINEIIRTKRLERGLTQEGLAQCLGVSAPAVNKWERCASYPDITLLPVLARILGVDLNTLLSFQEDMTREEIGTFLNQLAETARGEGCSAAFQLAKEKLREFPNNDLLAYETAGILEGSLSLWPGGGEEDNRTWREEISALYERSARSADPQVRGWANYMLLARAISQGELERAEELLAQLPDAHRGKPDLEAALRRKQGRREESWVILEGELLNRASAIQSTLLSMIDLALEEKDRERARWLAQKSAETGRMLGLMEYAVDSAPFQVAVAEQNGPQALNILERMLRSLTEPWDLRESPLYRHLPVKEGAGEVQGLMIRPVLDEVERDPRCAFLRETPGYRELMERYKRTR